VSDQARQSNWIAGSGTLFAPVESVPNLWNTATGTVLVSSQSQRQYNYKAGETGIYIFYIMTVNVSLKICSTACQCWTKACKLYWTRNTQGAFKANWKQSSFTFQFPSGSCKCKGVECCRNIPQNEGLLIQNVAWTYCRMGVFWYIYICTIVTQLCVFLMVPYWFKNSIAN